MAPVNPEPVTLDELKMVLLLRNVQAAKIMQRGDVTQEDAIREAEYALMAMGYRAAVAESGQSMADDVERFLEGQ